MFFAHGHYMDTPQAEPEDPQQPLLRAVSTRKSRLLACTENACESPTRTVSLTARQEVLIGAAAAGDKATVEALLDDGVDPNGNTTDGQTALDVAATGAIKDLLCKRGGVNGPRNPEDLIARFLHRLFG